ncbi:MAG: WbqC family protein, partial [Arenimonas sp.]
MNRQSVAIVQPTFLPWAGWFDLVDQADTWILLDDVAFSKQSWQQRNRIRDRDGLAWLSVPVRSAGKLGQPIREVELAGDEFVRRFCNTIRANYARAACFEACFAGFEAALQVSAATGMLSDLNRGLIDWLAGQLGVATPRFLSSELPVKGRRGEYVARLCEHVGANLYLSPAGAEDYLREDLGQFEVRSIAIELQAYEHPVYKQCFEPFASHASVLDLLFNEG